ncbi:hypothetical protein ACU4HD_20985 [Cupriavidus basilensis]
MAREAGLNPNTFYRHFRDMEDLALTAVAEVSNELRPMLRAVRWAVARASIPAKSPRAPATHSSPTPRPTPTPSLSVRAAAPAPNPRCATRCASCWRTSPPKWRKTSSGWRCVPGCPARSSTICAATWCPTCSTCRRIISKTAPRAGASASSNPGS